MGSNFRGKSKKTLTINFHGFKFRDSNSATSLGAWHCCISDDVSIHALAIFKFVTNKAIPTETWTKGMRPKNISVEDAVSWMTVATVSC